MTIEEAYALTTTEESPKKIFIDVYTDWCGWCKRMDKATFQRPVEACNFRDHYEDLVDKGFEVVGVSADSVKRQLNFSTKQKLNFSLIADEEKSIISAFEAWGNKKFMGKEYDGIFRHTYVIDEQGKIEHVLEKVKTKEATEQILLLY